MSFRRKYPVRRHVYTQNVGMLLPAIVKKIFLQLGASRVWIPKGQGNNVDIKVWSSNGKLIIVGEILNWSINSMLSTKRRNKMISNLKKYSCNKVLIYTNLNRKHLLNFSLNRISQIRIGYQVLPVHYYNFFLGKKQTTNRRPYSLSVKRDIQNKIKKYLKRRKICI